MITIKQVLAEAKKAGLIVTKSVSKVNGRSAYYVSGQHGLFTKSGLIKLLGIGA